MRLRSSVDSASGNDAVLAAGRVIDPCSAISATFLLLVFFPTRAWTFVARDALEQERLLSLLEAGFQFLCGFPAGLQRNREVRTMVSCPVEFFQARGWNLCCN